MIPKERIDTFLAQVTRRTQVLAEVTGRLPHLARIAENGDAYPSEVRTKLEEVLSAFTTKSDETTPFPQWLGKLVYSSHQMEVKYKTHCFYNNYKLH